VPASAPIRNVILKIDAMDENGKPLPWAGGKKGLLPPLAGFGNPKTKRRGPRDWAGLPGRMYAKVYRSAVIPKLGRPLMGVGGFAAEAEVFNTLLHYKKPDRAQFVFKVPEGVRTIKVKARLVYRWAYKPLAERKGWNMPDLHNPVGGNHKIKLPAYEPLMIDVHSPMKGGFRHAVRLRP